MQELHIEKNLLTTISALSLFLIENYAYYSITVILLLESDIFVKSMKMYFMTTKKLVADTHLIIDH